MWGRCFIETFKNAASLTAGYPWEFTLSHRKSTFQQIAELCLLTKRTMEKVLLLCFWCNVVIGVSSTFLVQTSMIMCLSFLRLTFHHWSFMAEPSTDKLRLVKWSMFLCEHTSDDTDEISHFARILSSVLLMSVSVLYVAERNWLCAWEPVNVNTCLDVSLCVPCLTVWVILKLQLKPLGRSGFCHVCIGACREIVPG